jgi:predicted nuclease of predicted toxin-antitoxin system
VKLLFDENLSPKLVEALADLFPDSKHVDRIGLGGGSDTAVWEYAKDNGYILVSKDSDFYDKSAFFGHPPKVIWVRRGNCSNRQIRLLLRNKADAILAFAQNPELSFIKIM